MEKRSIECQNISGPSAPSLRAPSLRMPALRSPDQVMRLERMGSFHPMRLSFSRQLTRRMQREDWQIDFPRFELDERGFGHAVIRAKTPHHTYSLVAFCHHIDDDMRSDRVIAEAWDATFTLFDGEPSLQQIKQMEQTVPVQEAGRQMPEQLSLSRANKSLRLFNHVVDALADGRQPNADMINQVGYVMRTTAVYGNGKFGIADRRRIADRDGMMEPFQAEMLSVYLIRTFSLKWIEHMAKVKGGDKAIALDRTLARHMGVGNSTGLGMAPFLVNHPNLLNNWMQTREQAIAIIKAKADISADAIDQIKTLAYRGAAYIAEWRVDDDIQMQRIIQLAAEWQDVIAWLNHAPNWQQSHPLSAACIWAETTLSLEAEEMLHSILMEPFGADLDQLCSDMAAVEMPVAANTCLVGDMIALIRRHYGWALAINLNDQHQSEVFWYTSAAKLEPRLGKRYEEDGAEREMPFDIPRQIQSALADLETADREMSIPRFMMAFPQHRFILNRVLIMKDAPYGEIRDNLVAEKTRPIDMLRCKLSFFGASKFDPKSDLWTRICLFQGAPLIDEMTDHIADDWLFSALS